jgi:DMSO/TMAO reductase YedYZ molybdopterin-dependent catalytic subunit
MSDLSRRDALRYLTSAGVALGSVGLGWPALAQDEKVVPFTDVPVPTGANARIPPNLDVFFTPNDTFFAVQHYNVPAVDAATYRLRVDGLVNRPLELSLADLRARRRIEQIIGFECSGNNNPRANPLVGNARWAGVSLATLLRDAGLKPSGREIVFFGADTGMEEITHGGMPQRVEQHFGRSMSADEALRSDAILAYEMNGAALPQAHGAPLRLLVPGWYGVANVKWLERIHVQDARFVNRFMGRDYVTLRGEGDGPALTWNETSVSRIRIKSAIGRVTQIGSTYRIVGFALTDGTPLRSIEVKIDDGPWREAVMSRENTQYSWKIFTYQWTGATPGDHTLVSRATDIQGNVQPTQDDPNKKSRWENNGQFVRKIKLS